ncbi:D-mannose-1-phosphate guanyltransferase [Candidatus Marinamargulisbacteria bacterium SCGC AG-410-N11]|nr:D-mannose-1-phosphate guanyltransferase [Candidatus Marinamargulisbacteria bacterium SCGC AG-410-N11]
MINKPVLILAGGLGTRLNGHLPENLPKPLAPIEDRPFLSFIFDRLIDQGISNVVLSVGYHKEKIMNFYNNRYKSLKITYSKEDFPLGTGGAILNSLDYLKNDDFILMNGDTFFDICLDNLYQFHKNKNSLITVALKKLSKKNIRFGSVTTDSNFKIIKFNSKSKDTSTLINGGIYFINKNLFSNLQYSSPFSFEKIVLEKNSQNFSFYGKVYDNFFIDIGIPEDLIRAQYLLNNIKRK